MEVEIEDLHLQIDDLAKAKGAVRAGCGQVGTVCPCVLQCPWLGTVNASLWAVWVPSGRGASRQWAWEAVLVADGQGLGSHPEAPGWAKLSMSCSISCATWGGVEEGPVSGVPLGSVQALLGRRPLWRDGLGFPQLSPSAACTGGRHGVQP